jgi:hypothetical protein
VQSNTRPGSIWPSRMSGSSSSMYARSLAFQTSAAGARRVGRRAHRRVSLTRGLLEPRRAKEIRACDLGGGIETRTSKPPDKKACKWRGWALGADPFLIFDSVQTTEDVSLQVFWSPDGLEPSTPSSP